MSTELRRAHPAHDSFTSPGRGSVWELGWWPLDPWSPCLCFQVSPAHGGCRHTVALEGLVLLSLELQEQLQQFGPEAAISM